MITINIADASFFDEEKNEFVDIKGQELQLEHSLISISKWESKWKKSFISTNNKTSEEILDYVRCMTLTQKVDPNVYYALSNENINQVNEYINDSMTATFFSKDKSNGGGKREIITSELIYYWMIAQNIPMECQKWHLNRLLTLIRVCSIKNTPPKKRSKSEMMAERSALNAKRKAAMNSRG